MTISGNSNKKLITAVAAGLAASAVTGLSDKILGLLVSREQKQRDSRLREGTAHEMAGPYLAQKITGHPLDKKGRKRARTLFSFAYSLMWGVVYAGFRKKAPKLSKFAGVPFAIPFFLACDGLIAPLLGISPSLRRVPWQPSAKEMANHIVWTATAEMVHRMADRK